MPLSFVGSDINIGCYHPVCQSPLMIYVYYYCIVKCFVCNVFHENKYCLNHMCFLFHSHIWISSHFVSFVQICIQYGFISKGFILPNKCRAVANLFPFRDLFWVVRNAIFCTIWVNISTCSRPTFLICCPIFLICCSFRYLDKQSFCKFCFR